MSLSIVAIGILLLSLPAAATRLTLGPATQVRLACVSVTSGIATLGVGAVLAASPLVMWWRHGDEIQGISVSQLSPGGPWAWAAAGVLAALGSIWCVDSVRRTYNMRRQAALPRWAAASVERNTDADVEVRVADVATAIAFAVPGRDHHIVISRGLTEQLTPDALRAVLAHEGAHLRLRHDRHLLVLSTYSRFWGWLPGVASVVRAHRDAVERWADADAAHTYSLPAHDFVDAHTTLCQPARAADVGQPAKSADHWWRIAAVWSLLAFVLLLGGLTTMHAINEAGALLAALH